MLRAAACGAIGRQGNASDLELLARAGRENPGVRAASDAAAKKITRPFRGGSVETETTDHIKGFSTLNKTKFLLSALLAAGSAALFGAPENNPTECKLYGHDMGTTPVNIPCSGRVSAVPGSATIYQYEDYVPFFVTELQGGGIYWTETCRRCGAKGRSDHTGHDVGTSITGAIRWQRQQQYAGNLSRYVDDPLRYVRHGGPRFRSGHSCCEFESSAAFAADSPCMAAD